MQTGQVFKVDSQAIKEMATYYKRPEGDFSKLDGLEFSIAKSKTTQAVTDKEVRATKWVDGKPQRGRPRKFPRTTVARLLGETDDASLSAPDDSADSSDSSDSQADSSALDDAAEQLIAASADASEDAASNDTW